MKEKFIEWFTAGNSGYAPAIDADGKFEKEKTQHMWEAYQAGLASAEAQVKQLAAENAFLMHRIDWPKQQCPTTGDVTDVEPDDFIPSTDAAIASLRAEGVEMLAAHHQSIVDKLDGDSLFGDGSRQHSAIAAAATYFAAQLRSKSEVQPCDADKKQISEQRSYIDALENRLKQVSDARDELEARTVSVKLPENIPCPGAPQTIWLQTNGDDSNESSWPENSNDVSWCWEKMFHNDTLYVRADLAAGIKLEVGE